jgi:AraC-like DNA-binding protein
MIIKLIDAEINITSNKKTNIVDRLTEVLFIQLLNKFVNENEHLLGFLAVLNAPRLKNILKLIHRNPEKQWILDLISDEVGMSRARLQRKFKAGVSISPMAYVSH